MNSSFILFKRDKLQYLSQAINCLSKIILQQVQFMSKISDKSIEEAVYRIEKATLERQKQSKSKFKIHSLFQFSKENQREQAILQQVQCSFCGLKMGLQTLEYHYCIEEIREQIRIRHLQRERLNHELSKQQEQKKELELKLFEESKIKVGKLISSLKKEQKIPEYAQVLEYQNQMKQQKVHVQDQLDFIPCHFCGVPLTKNELNHINQCPQGHPCSYCKQRYPLMFYADHLIACLKRKQLYPPRGAKEKQSISQNSISIKGNKHLPKKRKIQQNVRPKQIKKLSRNFPQIVDYDNLSRIRQKQLKGMNYAQINRIRTEIFQGAFKEEQCLICTMELQAGQQVMRLQCLHIFHADCLKPWLQTQSRCPTCKTKVNH